MKPKISCVIPHYQQAAKLADCLEALANQKGAPAFEVIVVDDGSEIVPRVEGYGFEARIFSADHRGPAAARNLGAQQARAAALAFTDADCRPHPKWLAAVFRSLADDNRPAAVVGPLFDATPTARGFGVQTILHRFMQTISAVDHEPIEITYSDFKFVGTIGANFTITRGWFEQMGGFDENFVQPGGEDYDLGFRLQRAGGRVMFNPQATVDHHYPIGRHLLMRRWIHYGVGKAQFAAKHQVDPSVLDLVCHRRLHLLTRLPKILQVARRHYPPPVAPGWINRFVCLYVEWLFQVGAVRIHRQLPKAIGPKATGS